MSDDNHLALATRAIHGGQSPDPTTGAVMPPIYATSTYAQSSPDVIAMDDLYGGSYRLFEGVRRRSAALDFSFVDLTDPAKFETAIMPKTKLVWIETPTNPLLKIVDIAAIAAIAKQHGVLVAVDNTFRRRRALGDEVPERPLGCDRRGRGGCEVDG